MIPTIALMAMLQTATAADAPWTWSLYDGADPVVLAEEIPDTPRLRTTLQCERASGVVEVTLYRAATARAQGDAGAPGFVTLSAGGAAATSELTAEPDRLRFSVRTDHPVFAGFAADGGLTVDGLGRTRRIAAGVEGLPALRRFVGLCG